MAGAPRARRRPAVADPAREHDADQRQDAGHQEGRGPADAQRDLLGGGRSDRVHREEGEPEHAHRLAEPLGGRLIDGERRARHEGHREGDALHRAQQIEQRPHPVDGREREAGDRHQQRAGGQEVAPAEAIDQHAHRRQEDHHEEPEPGGDLPDLGRPRPQLRHQKFRQQEVVREGVAEARLRDQQLAEARSQQGSDGGVGRAAASGGRMLGSRASEVRA